MRVGRRFGTLAISVVLGASLGSPAAAHPHPPGRAETTAVSAAVLDLKAMTALEPLIQKLATDRVVYVGEMHDRFDHHLVQLEIIRGLHRKHPQLAIGMEFFQQPFQAVVDDYVAGRIEEEEFLKKTEYFERWRFDYRLYQPILRYAREKGITVVALNVPRELTERVAKDGLGALSEEERDAYIADGVDKEDGDYVARLRRVFDQHPPVEGRSFDNFLDAQLLWDEGMAERAARFLREHPDRVMVILAGAGHLESRQGIPSRLERRIPLQSSVVLNGVRPDIGPGLADYLVVSERQDLPPSGMLRVILDTKGGGVRIEKFAEGSGAAEAGLKEGDRIIRMGSRPIADYQDVRIALLSKVAGDEIEVEVERERVFLGNERHSYKVVLK